MTKRKKRVCRGWGIWLIVQQVLWSNPKGQMVFNGESSAIEQFDRPEPYPKLFPCYRQSLIWGLAIAKKIVVEV